jgi:TRAP-type C4-dicarboxylate transport system substrate-binding protein
MKPQMGALLGAALCLALGSAEAQEIRISHHYDDTIDARGRATRKFVEEAKLRAPDLEFRIYPKLSLGFTSVGQIDALQSGELEMALVPFPYAAEKRRHSPCSRGWYRASRSPASSSRLSSTTSCRRSPRPTACAS